ncbi:uncharacterized protein LAESUDRAFT_562110 [Laetiporus sulphureus 93-53]|uniref:Uncharacterized protein n=1 Tax=Laetiporus sulphureus 93-53 TaxID=1314785 RepID=A0A165B4L4_9APHY|nr:uncharacterized protein LAESUDRAFT_562110 [Laetiporus sulphureus 93-53]KZT00223.1 hypothetical protein LAESUDRAFT_562110 [Laetiporus sulphureus 93-53]
MTLPFFRHSLNLSTPTYESLTAFSANVARPRRSKDDNLPPVPLPSPSTEPTAHGVFRRITNKLRSPTIPHGETSSKSRPNPTSASQAISTPVLSYSQRKVNRSRSRARTCELAHAADAPQPPLTFSPRPRGPVPNTLQNSFTSPEQREAAFRALGLNPPPATSRKSRYRDADGFMIPLSEQEKVLDQRYAVVVEQNKGESGDDAESEAKKIKEAWLAQNTANRKQGQGKEQEQEQAPPLSAQDPEESEKQQSTIKGKPQPNRHEIMREEMARSRATPVDLPVLKLSEADLAAPDYSAILEAITIPPNPECLRRSMVLPDLPPPPPPVPDKPQTSTETRTRRRSDVSERLSKWLQSAVPSRSATESSTTRMSLLGRAHMRNSADNLVAPRPASRGSDRERGRRRLSIDSLFSRARSHSVGGRSSSAETPAHSTPRPPLTPRKPSAVPPSSFKGAPEQPPVLLTASPRSSESRARASPVHRHNPQSSVSTSNSLDSILDSASSQPRLSLSHAHGHRRGRSTTVSDLQADHALATPDSGLSAESRARGAPLPALSPTRSASSCTPSEPGLPTTPTTLSHSGECQRARRSQTTLHACGEAKAQAVYAREEDESEEGPASPGVAGLGSGYAARMESEAQKMRELMAAAASRSRTRKPSQESGRNKAAGLGIFGHKSEGAEEAPAFKNPRSMNSMQNIRRNVVGSLSILRRQRSTVDRTNSDSSANPAQSPVSPISPPSAFSAVPPSSFPAALRRKASATRDPSPGAASTKSTVGVGLRPRQALSPTIYDRGSILAEAGRIEDEESRRLSEAVFLDY